ncbi:MAG: phenylalanine 4-monooxygenase [Bacteroidetes bacterium]|nr:phenylalanine 4-monooxygenase [Bacteroidota bacterium]
MKSASESDAFLIDSGKTAYESAAEEGIDPRCVPIHLNGPVPVGDEIVTPDYSEEDQNNWKFLFNRQMDLLPGRAGDAFMNGVEELGITSEGIPSLAKMSERMEAVTNWRIARIPGLLHEKDFFKLISDRVFPSTDYLRGADELDYTPAPDCFHDMFGHMPMLSEPAFADYYQLFGQAAMNAEGHQRVQLERLHWFTVEFGLVRQENGLRIFGAGILSSKGEVAHAVNGEAKVIPFSADRVVEQEYEVWNLQPRLFALESFDQLVSEFRNWTKNQGLL